MQGSKFELEIISTTDSTRTNLTGAGRVLGSAISRGGEAIMKVLAGTGERLGQGPTAAVANFLRKLLVRFINSYAGILISYSTRAKLTSENMDCKANADSFLKYLRDWRRPQCSKILDYMQKMSCPHCLPHLLFALFGSSAGDGLYYNSLDTVNLRQLFWELCKKLSETVRDDHPWNAAVATCYLVAFIKLLGEPCRLRLVSFHKLDVSLEARFGSLDLLAADSPSLVEALNELRIQLQEPMAFSFSRDTADFLASLPLDSRFAIFPLSPILYIRAAEVEANIWSLYNMVLFLLFPADVTMPSHVVLGALIEIWYQASRSSVALPERAFDGVESTYYCNAPEVIWDNEPSTVRRAETFYCAILTWRGSVHSHAESIDVNYVDADGPQKLFMTAAPRTQNGNMLAWITRHQTASVYQQLHEVAQSIQSLHSQGVIHKNFRCCGILLDAQGHIKLDSAWSSTYMQDGSLSNMDCIASPLEPWSPATDAWLFGCACFEALIMWRRSVPKLTMDELRDLIDDGIRPMRLPHIADDTWKLLHRCWEIDPTERPSFKNIVAELNHLSTNLAPRKTRVHKRSVLA
ncbi:kinase-like protein [Punctularia strigosozonata HHB-11173 SS5]|uniref:kinase-like protein n=1 Tax=Punctularia strigosozonata (strain HHB-11173) TaxID=741275 RepID=UPI0004417D12|nr:kinase-like protein [Punctularia strigosozonata HHB-11173 SS5]EIN07483.1 kinase-like protein [Punctularia strigosozonata HHB-11173 SS5]